MSMFDNLKNLAGLMGQAKQMREKMEQVQSELARKTVQADSGAGTVTVTMNGRFEVLNVSVDPHMISTLAGSGSAADRQMIEDLIAAACNAAHEKAQALIREEIQKVTGGLNLPGMEGLLH